MLKNLLQFEMRFHTRQIAFYLGLILFFVMGFLVTGRLGYAGKVFVNSPHLVTSVYLFIGLYLPIAMSVLTVNAVLRDDMHNATAMVYSSHISAKQFILSRYLGLVLTATGLIIIGGLAILLRTYFSSGIEGDFTDTHIAYYLWTLLVFLLPNILLFAAISFAVACFSRSVIMTYLSGLVIYILYMLSATFVDSSLFAGSASGNLGTAQLLIYIDPFGMSAYEIATQFWTATEKNTQLVSLSGDLLFNRVIWLSISGLILTLVLHKFKLNLEYKASAKQKKSANSLDGRSVNQSNLNSQLRYTTITPSTSNKRHWLALKSSVGLEMSYLMKSYAFWVVVGLWTFFLFGEIYTIIKSAEFSSPLYPMTSRVLDRFMYDLLPRFSLFVLVFYSADMVWREKDLKMAAFIDASPTKGSVFFLSKFFALSLIPFFFITIAIAVGLFFQWLNNYSDYEMTLYFSVYYYAGLPLLLTIAMCLFVQVLVPNKYIGMLVSVFVLLFLGTNLSGFIGLEHNLWHFAKAPELNYSDMNGFDQASFSFAVYMLYWGSFALLLCLLGFGLWRRGSDVSFSNRRKQIVSQLGQSGARFSLVCLMLFIGSGSYIFYQTNIAANYYSSADSEQFRVDYENQFKKFAELAQPSIDSVNTKVDLYPSDSRFEVTGEYQLINRTKQTINQVLIELSGDLNLTQLILKDNRNQQAKLVLNKPNLGGYVFDLIEPLKPAQQLTLTFSLDQQQSGFADFSKRSMVTKNSTLLYLSSQLPRVGYVKQKALQNEKLREKNGLEKLPAIETIEQSLAKTQGIFSGEDDFIRFETIVSTDKGQTAITSGDLIEQWQKDGRAYFHYKTDQAIRNALIYISSNYAVAKEKFNDIDIAVYYHPQHNKNIQRMLSGIKDSLSYQMTNFGNYPHQQFKQVEAAEYTGLSGYAAPTMTLMSEHAGFTYDLTNSEDYDQVYRRSAHEVAHQWWGHLIAPANIDEGSMLFVETLARYSESMIMKKVYGDEMALKFINFEMDRYFTGRARETDNELPLYRTRNDQRYLMYSKGAVAMYALQNTIGEDRVNLALRSLVEKYRFPNNPPASLDLLNEFYAVAPEYKAYIDEWFKQMTYVEMQLNKADATKLNDGTYEISLDINLVKKQVDNLGEESAIEATQLIEVVVTVEVNGEMKTETHQIELVSGVNQIKLNTQNKPSSVDLDPRSLLLNKNKSQAKSEVVLVN